MINNLKNTGKVYGKVRSSIDLIIAITLSIILFGISMYLFRKKITMKGKTKAVYIKDCILDTTTRDVECDKTTYLQYTINGKKYKTKYKIPESKEKHQNTNIGDTVNIRYNKEKPEDITHNMWSPHDGAKLCLGISILLLLGAISRYIFCQYFPLICGVSYIASNVKSAFRTFKK